MAGLIPRFPGATVGARRSVALLATGYGLSASCISLVVAVAPLVGAHLAPTGRLATLPLSLGILATMATTYPASILMGRIGRRGGLWIGTTIGAAGAFLASTAIMTSNFVLFCIGSIAIGTLNGFAQFYRFAAADIAVDWRPRAISYVLAGGIMAGVLGPWLAVRGADVLAAPFMGSYLAMLPLLVVAATLLLWVQAPAANVETIGNGPTWSPRFRVAVALGMVAYGVMALVMTATPLAMRGNGHSLAQGGLVIQVHVVAMFAPSFVTGRLIERLGAIRVAAMGATALLATPMILLAGTTVGHYVTALALLGVGWNFLFVTGSAIVAGMEGNKARAQGTHDLFVFGAAAGGSFLAGYLYDAVGAEMHLWLLPALVGALVGVALLGRMAKPKEVVG